jgi:hypothetical protein
MAILLPFAYEQGSTQNQLTRTSVAWVSKRKIRGSRTYATRVAELAIFHCRVNYGCRDRSTKEPQTCAGPVVRADGTQLSSMGNPSNPMEERPPRQQPRWFALLAEFPDGVHRFLA